MPRPQRPDWQRFRFLFNDAELSDLVGLRPHESRYHRLKAEVQHSIGTYQTGWTRERGPGRPSTKRRNELIVELATVFQNRSGWTANDRRDYLENLQEFIFSVLVANNIFPRSTRLQRLIPRNLRAPRS
jgi:hypothetical protein